MADITASTWSQTDASNSSASPEGAPEGMMPAGVNNTMRMMMGALKRWYAWMTPATTAGTSTAYTLSYSVAPSALVDGMSHLVQFNATCGASPTLNVNSLGALPLHYMDTSGTWVVVPSGRILANSIHRVVYNSSAGTYRITSSPYAMALSALNVMTTRGDIIYQGASAPQRLALGASGTMLISDGTDPTWDTILPIDLATDVTGTLANSHMVTTTTSWTPADASGAGLSFSGVSAIYQQIGGWVFASFTLTFPATGSGSDVLISGLPVAVPNQNYAQAPAVVHTPGFAIVQPIALPIKNSSNIQILNYGGRLTNANLSGVTISAVLVYPAS